VQDACSPFPHMGLRPEGWSSIVLDLYSTVNRLVRTSQDEAPMYKDPFLTLRSGPPAMLTHVRQLAPEASSGGRPRQAYTAVPHTGASSGKGVKGGGQGEGMWL